MGWSMEQVKVIMILQLSLLNVTRWRAEQINLHPEPWALSKISISIRMKHLFWGIMRVWFSVIYARWIERLKKHWLCPTLQPAWGLKWPRQSVDRIYLQNQRQNKFKTRRNQRSIPMNGHWVHCMRTVAPMIVTLRSLLSWHFPWQIGWQHICFLKDLCIRF